MTDLVFALSIIALATQTVASPCPIVTIRSLAPGNPRIASRRFGKVAPRQRAASEPSCSSMDLTPAPGTERDPSPHALATIVNRTDRK